MLLGLSLCCSMQLECIFKEPIACSAVFVSAGLCFLTTHISVGKHLSLLYTRSERQRGLGVGFTSLCILGPSNPTNSSLSNDEKKLPKDEIL